MKTPPRKLLALIWLAVLAALVLAIACGGGDDDDSGGTGQLSDPQNVPTATPWAEPPEIILLDPDNIQPLPTDPPAGGPGDGGDGGDGGEATPPPEGGEPGVCGDTYTVVAEDTTFGIAEKCGVNPDDIIAANPEIGDGRSLTVGQVLVMPDGSGDSEEQ